MFNAEDELIIKLEASCTKEEAVAKMLGWLQGPIRKRVIQVTEYGISADQTPHLLQLESSLEEHLLELRNAARTLFIKALEEDEPFAVIEEKENAVIECDNLIKWAAIYLEDITEELAKGEDTSLKIDQEATKKSDTTYITLKSLKGWALNEYDIAIDSPFMSRPVDDDPQEQLKSQQKEAESDQAAWLSKTKAENLYTTFAFLVEAFAETAPKYKNGDKPNAENIAKHLEELVKKANTNRGLSGQGSQTIRKLIRLALKTKAKTLHNKME